MRQVITIYCDEEDTDLIKRAVIRTRDYIQNSGEKGDIWLSVATLTEEALD